MTRVCLFYSDYYPMMLNTKGNPEKPEQILHPTKPSVRKAAKAIIKKIKIKQR